MNRHINFIDDIKYLFELFLVFRNTTDSTFSVCTKPNIYSPLASKLAGINKYIHRFGEGTDFLRRKTENTCEINFNLPLQIIFSLSKLVWFTNPNDMNYFLNKNIIKEINRC